MRTTWFGPICAPALIAAALMAGVTAGPAAAGDTAITVAVSTQGVPVQVDLDCVVTQNGVERHELRHGTAPLRIEFNGSSLACTINAAGPVVIEAQSADGGSVSRIQTSGGQVYLNLSLS